MKIIPDENLTSYVGGQLDQRDNNMAKGTISGR